MNWDIQVQEALADMLKVPWRERPVRSFDLTVRLGEVPRLTVYYDVYNDEHINQSVGEFEVWAVGGTLEPVPAFDLDAMVAKAQECVAAHVDKLYTRHLKELVSSTTYFMASPLRWPFWTTEKGENYTNMVGYGHPDDVFKESERSLRLNIQGG